MEFLQGEELLKLDGGQIDALTWTKYCLRVKVRELIKMIEADGWFLVRTKGSHRQYKHLTKKGLVTVSGNLNHDIAPGTLNSALKQAGLKK